MEATPHAVVAPAASGPEQAQTALDDVCMLYSRSPGIDTHTYGSPCAPRGLSPAPLHVLPVGLGPSAGSVPRLLTLLHVAADQETPDALAGSPLPQARRDSMLDVEGVQTRNAAGAAPVPLCTLAEHSHCWHACMPARRLLLCIASPGSQEIAACTEHVNGPSPPSARPQGSLTALCCHDASSSCTEQMCARSGPSTQAPAAGPAQLARHLH